MCRIRRFLAILRSFFHFSLLCTFSCHPSPPTILPSSLTPSCHLFLGLPLNFVPRFIYNILWGILFSSILCTCPNQRNLFNLTVSITVGLLTLAWVWLHMVYIYNPLSRFIKKVLPFRISSVSILRHRETNMKFPLKRSSLSGILFFDLLR